MPSRSQSADRLDCVAAIFHASFHPTKGNVIDWALRATEDVNLEGVEFSVLPSGLHHVEEDVVYFTTSTTPSSQGVAVFRRKPTTLSTHRGFHLSSLGVVLSPKSSRRPRPWRHVQSLKFLVNKLHEGETDNEDDGEEKWERQKEDVREWFEERKASADVAAPTPSAEAVQLDGWISEIENDQTPISHLPHIISILGPSLLTLYKYVTCRKRVLIYTTPHVEKACVLALIGGDLANSGCWDLESNWDEGLAGGGRWLKPRQKDGINVLGMVTLNDLERLEREGKDGKGWIACTTDALYLEKQYTYDLLIDLTMKNSKSTRPQFYTPKPPNPERGQKKWELSIVGWTWSDVRIWNELKSLLQSCPPHTSPPISDPKPKPKLSWGDVYEDFCIFCASLWVGSWWRIGWGGVRLEGDDVGLEGAAEVQEDVGLDDVRNVGEGADDSGRNTAMQRSRAMSWKDGGKGKTVDVGVDPANTAESHADADGSGDQGYNKTALLTLALVRTLHATTTAHLSLLAELLPPLEEGPQTIHLMPKVLSNFGLSPWSAGDAKYLEWLAEEWGGGRRIIVMRTWKDFAEAIFRSAST